MQRRDRCSTPLGPLRQVRQAREPAEPPTQPREWRAGEEAEVRVRVLLLRCRPLETAFRACGELCSGVHRCSRAPLSLAPPTHRLTARSAAPSNRQGYWEGMWWMCTVVAPRPDGTVGCRVLAPPLGEGGEVPFPLTSLRPGTDMHIWP